METLAPIATSRGWSSTSEAENRHPPQTLRRAIANTPIEHIAHSPRLLGLFVPPPAFPHERTTLGQARALATAIVAFAILVATAGAVLALGSFLILLLVPLLTFLGPPAAALFVAHRLLVARGGAQDAAAAAHRTMQQQQRRRRRAEADSAALNARADEILAAVAPQLASNGFRGHIAEATGLAVYGCGILAAAHVGALAALEKYGLRYEKLETLAGVSAGAVIVACIACGHEAEGLARLVESMPFHRLAYPELGALLRVAGNLLLTLARLLRRGGSIPWAVQEVSSGNGPGLNSGAALEAMVGEALASRPDVDAAAVCPECNSGRLHRKCCAPNITLAQVKQRYGKRLVLLVSELDTGRERALTPETDPNLPLRVAVRMSMGVPGLCEPFKYGSHVYCDGGMCNDFPIAALPDDGHRLGLMVRPREWMLYNMGRLERVVGQSTSSKEHLYESIAKIDERLKERGIYPTRDFPDLIMTSVQTMMDANLALQISMAKITARDRGTPTWASVASPCDAAADDDADMGFFALCPHIFTLCGGSLSPFDMGLGKAQHRELYRAGQLSVHLAAALAPGSEQVMSDEERFDTLRYLISFGGGSSVAGESERND